jgi:flagellar export protein FliJ
MKSFKTLLKIAKRELDALRRALGDANKRLAETQARIVQHDTNVAAERALSARDYESARAFTAYAALAKQQRAALMAERASIEAEIEGLRKLIAEAHVESRKFERLIELEEAREKTRREKREDAELDEMATLRAGRARPA